MTDSKPLTPDLDRGDYTFIVKIIHYVDMQFGIRFFITSRDFDVLYRWWEKRIPLEIIRESIADVVARRKSKGREIKGFTGFSYEVRKNFKAFLELSSGEGGELEERGGDEMEAFFDDFPGELTRLKGEFERVFQQFTSKEKVEMAPIDEALLELFEDDRESDRKTRIFMRSLAPELRTAEIERKYRLNLLKHRFNIPDFEMS